LRINPPFDHTSSHESFPSLTEFTRFLPSHKRIQPIPIIRKYLPNSAEFRAKFQAYGYKHFSKISAAGPHTPQILNSIRMSICPKMVHKFEFDPYLCDLSCLSQLNIVSKKLRTMKQVTVVIRRLDDPSELNKMNGIGRNIAKLPRLTKLKIEFPSNSNIGEGYMIPFHHTLRKCYLLKFLEWIVVESPLLSPEYLGTFIVLMKKLKKLESFKDYMTLKKGALSAEFFNVENMSAFPKIPRIRNLEMIYSSCKDWAQMGEEGYFATQIMKQYISSHPSLERFKVRLIRNSFFAQDTLEFMKTFALMPHFRHLDFEFLNCSLSDDELALFFYGLTFIRQVKYVCLKVIQNVPISIEYIERFIAMVSNMPNIEKFDFYFRKIMISRTELSQYERAFSRFQNVQCSFCPQSVHIFKNNNKISIQTSTNSVEFIEMM